MNKHLRPLLSLSALCACHTQHQQLYAPLSPADSAQGTAEIKLQASPRASKASTALTVFRHLAKDTADNIVFSPASMEGALRSLKQGARGNTAAQLSCIPSKAPTPTMNVVEANGIFVNESIQLKPGISADTIERVPFGTSAANSYIADWVKKKTHGFIPDFSSSAAEDPGTKMLIVNAVYLKERWLTPFESRNTKTEKFTDSAGKKHRVDMMHQTGVFNYAQGKNWQAVALPYKSGGYFIGILPNGNAHTFAASLTPQLYNSIIQAVAQSNKEIELGLPTFDINTQPISLATALQHCGSGDIFSGKANFSGFANTQLTAQDLIQRCRIKLDEEGTEAAAVSEIPMWLLEETDPPKPLKLTFDRPFIWIITEADTNNTPYFMGVFAEP